MTRNNDEGRRRSETRRTGRWITIARYQRNVGVVREINTFRYTSLHVSLGKKEAVGMTFLSAIGYVNRSLSLFFLNPTKCPIAVHLLAYLMPAAAAQVHSHDMWRSFHHTHTTRKLTRKTGRGVFSSFSSEKKKKKTQNAFVSIGRTFKRSNAWPIPCIGCRGN